MAIIGNAAGDENSVRSDVPSMRVDLEHKPDSLIVVCIAVGDDQILLFLRVEPVAIKPAVANELAISDPIGERDRRRPGRTRGHRGDVSAVDPEPGAQKVLKAA